MNRGSSVCTTSPSTTSIAHISAVCLFSLRALTYAFHRSLELDFRVDLSSFSVASCSHERPSSFWCVLTQLVKKALLQSVWSSNDACPLESGACTIMKVHALALCTASTS